MKTLISHARLRLSWKLSDLRFFVTVQITARFLNSQFWKVWLPLWLVRHVGLDVWYATKILGWKMETDPFRIAGQRSFHFHRQNGWVVRPTDYSVLYPSAFPC